MSFQPIIDAIVGFFAAVVTFFELLIVVLLDKLDELFTQVFQWLGPLIPSEAMDILTDLVGFWGDVEPVVSFITYFVPVWGIMGIIVATYYAVAGIRIIRWLLGIIPTMSLG